ncbi:sulfotransferase family protein [Nocardioides salsibiostraticola]
MSKIVIVTGSGRSGTSSAAGTLKRLGLQIPQPEVEADERNPRGYYEPLWVADFHKYFLNAIPVRTIDSRPHAGQIAMDAVTPEREAELREWLAAEVAAQPEAILAIKETRAYWVYPLWLRIAAELGIEVSSLTMLRHPTQVVRSRDAAYLSEESDTFRRQRETTNVAAWMNSVFETERATRGNPRAFVPYYDLIGDWRTTMGRAGEQMGVDLAVGADAHEVDDFLTASLNRSGADWDGLMVAGNLVEMAEETWTHAGVLVADPSNAEAMAGLDRLRAAYVELYESSAAIALDETVSQVAAVRKNLKRKLETKQRRIEKLRAEVAELKGQPTG